MPESPSVSPRASVVFFHRPRAPSLPAAQAHLAPRTEDEARLDLVAAFQRAGFDVALACSAADHMLAHVRAGTLELGSVPLQPLFALPVDGWHALQDYSRATHGGNGIHTVMLGQTPLSPELLEGLEALEDLEHLHIALEPKDASDPQAKDEPALQTMSLMGLRQHPRLREVHVDCRWTTAPWTLLAPDKLTVKGTSAQSQAKVKVQYLRADDTRHGDALPLDGQQYVRKPLDAQACTLKEFVLAQEDILRTRLNGAAAFKMDGQVLYKSTSKSRGLVTCRHLSTRWLLDRRMHHQAKRRAKKGFSFRNYRKKEALREHVPYSVEAVYTHISRSTPEVVCHANRLGESVAQMFEDMTPGEVGMFSIELERHSVACELQVKTERTDAGPRKRYVLSFYDPEATATHTRISSTDADSFKALTLERLVGARAMADYCGGGVDPRELNLKIWRVFDLAADGTERSRPHRTQTLLAPGYEFSPGYLRQCVEANRHDEVSAYVRSAFARWQQQPPPRRVDDLLCSIDLFRAAQGDLQEYHCLYQAIGHGMGEAVAVYASEVLKGAKALGLPAELIKSLLPPQALHWVADALEVDGVSGPAASVHGYLRPILDTDVLSMDDKREYIGDRQTRGLKQKTFAQVGLKAVPTGRGGRRTRAAEAVGAALCTIVECKLAPHQKAELIAELGEPPRAILRALHKELKANPDAASKEWLGRIVMRITPDIFGPAVSEALRKEFAANASAAA